MITLFIAFFFFFRLQLELYRAARFYISLEVAFQKVIEIEEVTTITFRTTASDLLHSTPVEEEVMRHIDMLAVDIEKFIRNGNLL